MAAYQNPTLGGPGTVVQPSNAPSVMPGAPPQGVSGGGFVSPQAQGGQFSGTNSPFAPVPDISGPLPPGMPPGIASLASAGPADYAGVQEFTDQAYQQARRNIDPMQEQQSRRMEQDLVNKGIDPSSEQGMAMLDQQNRNFSDQNNSATFGAMQFGQGIQNQMFGQDFQNQQMVNQMTGTNIQADIARSGQSLDRYGIDRNYALGMGNLDMNRQGQSFNQMIGLNDANLRNLNFDRQGNQYQDALTQALMGQTPIPGVQPQNPAATAGGMLQRQPGIFG